MAYSTPPDFRQTYAADLKKMLPRISFARDFQGFVRAGRTLSELHLDDAAVDRYPLHGLEVERALGVDSYEFFAVRDKKMRFGSKNTDKSVIEYNPHITLGGIPEEAHRYVLGSRSAIEWLIDRYYIRTDKASGIVNDPNDWSREVGDPRYIIDLIARIVTVSVETVKVVEALPALQLLTAN